MSYVLASGASITYGNQTVFDGLAKYTVSYWIWPATVAASAGYLSRASSTSPWSGWSIGTAYSLPRCVGGMCAAGQTYDVWWSHGYEVLTAGAWNHVLVTYDGTQVLADRVKLWVNRVSKSLAVNANVPAALGTVTGGAVLTVQNTTDTIRLAELGIWTGTAITETAVIDQLGASANAVPPNEVGVSGLRFYMAWRTDANETVTNATPTLSGAVLDASHPPVVTTNIPTLSVRVQESQVGGATF